MLLYGKTWTRRELEARVGRIDALGGVRKYCLNEGPEAGIELIQVRTGSGLSYWVNAFHGLDISLAEFFGVPISWQSVNGEIHPAFYDPRGSEWLRTAAGGLLMTCGLTNVGSPSSDKNEELGLHGRLHHLPARQVVAESYWQADELEMRIKGVVEENRIFGENLRLTREIKSKLGENRIFIEDVVENIGFENSPHMILYHFNFGFPLMTKSTQILFPSKQVRPRENETPLEGFDRWQEPEVGYQERVYYHENFMMTKSDRTKTEMASVIIKNSNFALQPAIPLAVRLSWSAATLPKLIQWKMPRAGINALGIEPANCLVEGRAAERQRGTLVILEPGASVQYFLEIEILINE